MTRAQALMAVCYLYTTEADSVLYAWPPLSDDERTEAFRLSDLAKRVGEDGATISTDPDGDWRAVMDWFGGAQL